MSSDLFGEAVPQRDAVFGAGGRLELTRSWGQGLHACVIGHNPSDAGRDREDPTSRWWNNWFTHFGFGSYTAVNLYPWITADPREIYSKVENINAGLDWASRDELHFTNLETVKRVAKAADRVFVCWGAIARDQEWIEHLIDEIQFGEEPWPALWCWGKTASGAPKHPMARGKHRIDPLQEPILWRASR